MNYNRIEESLCGGDSGLEGVIDFQTLAEAIAEREESRWYTDDEKPYGMEI